MKEKTWGKVYSTRLEKMAKDDNLNWFDYKCIRCMKKDIEPILRIQKGAICINSGVFRFIGEPEKLMLGYNRSLKAIAIRKWNGIEDVPSYDFRARAYRGTLKICAKNFVNMLEKETGLSFEKSTSFLFDADSSAVGEKAIFYIKKENSSI